MTDLGKVPEPVKPDRDTIARAMWEASEDYEWSESWDEAPLREQNHWRHFADAVLAVIPGRTEAVVKAEALREAAAHFGDADALYHPSGRLHYLADRIERGENPYLAARLRGEGS